MSSLDGFLVVGVDRRSISMFGVDVRVGRRWDIGGLGDVRRRVGGRGCDRAY